MWTDSHTEAAYGKEQTNSFQMCCSNQKQKVQVYTVILSGTKTG